MIRRQTMRSMTREVTRPESKTANLHRANHEASDTFNKHDNFCDDR